MESFCDLCIPDSPQVLPILEQLFRFNCHLVAIERSIDLDANPVPSLGASKDKRHLREGFLGLLEPPDLAPLNAGSNLGRYAAVHGSKAKLLSRLTIRFSKSEDASNFCKQFTAEIARFDLVAACPLTEPALAFACDHMAPLDLVLLDCWQKPSFRVSHAMVRRAVARGLLMEMLMAPMLASSACRGYTVSMAHSLMQITAGKSFVFSSGARSPWDVRNHVGLTCVAAMLGVPGPLAPSCLREAPRAVVLHALVRSHTAFGAVAIQKLERQRGVKSVTVVKPTPEARGDEAAGRKRVIDLDSCSSEPKAKKKKKKKKREVSS